MDLAKRIGQWTEQPPEQWIRAANRYLPTAISGLLILALGYKLAELTWALVPGAPPEGPAPVVGPRASTPAGAGPALDVSRVVEAHLFGEVPRERLAVVQAVVDAPDTTLNLQLTGIVSVSGEGRDGGVAIIATDRNQEKKYVVGQTVDGANGAQLHTVYGDRVILNRAGQLETLRLPKELTSRAAPVAARPMARAGNDSGSLREVISENASRITDIVRVAPQLEGGQMIGFRINPGRDREAFTALGLQPGDVITDINGMLLDDPSRGLQVFEALGEATMANVTIVRDGAPQVLVIDTSQLQSLAEQRQ